MSNLFSFAAGVATMLAVYVSPDWSMLALGCFAVVVGDTAWKRMWDKE